MNQPTVSRHIVVAITGPDGDVGHLEVQRLSLTICPFLVACHFSMLSLTGGGKKEAACRATLDETVDG